MTVRELIARLSEEDPERLVVLSIDAEGNGFGECGEVSTGAYDNKRIGLDVLTEGDRTGGYTEEDVIEGAPCVILWP